MSVNKNASRRSLKSDLARVDAHRIQLHEYDELPELTDEMIELAVLKRAGRPVATDPRKQVIIRLPESVLARWRKSGAGWQTRMAKVMEKRVP